MNVKEGDDMTTTKKTVNVKIPNQVSKFARKSKCSKVHIHTSGPWVVARFNDRWCRWFADECDSVVGIVPYSMFIFGAESEGIVAVEHDENIEKPEDGVEIHESRALSRDCWEALVDHCESGNGRYALESVAYYYDYSDWKRTEHYVANDGRGMVAQCIETDPEYTLTITEQPQALIPSKFVKHVLASNKARDVDALSIKIWKPTMDTTHRVGFAVDTDSDGTIEFGVVHSPARYPSAYQVANHDGCGYQAYPIQHNAKELIKMAKHNKLAFSCGEPKKSVKIGPNEYDPSLLSRAIGSGALITEAWQYKENGPLFLRDQSRNRWFLVMPLNRGK